MCDFHYFCILGCFFIHLNIIRQVSPLSFRIYFNLSTTMLTSGFNYQRNQAILLGGILLSWILGFEAIFSRCLQQTVLVYCVLSDLCVPQKQVTTQLKAVCQLASQSEQQQPVLRMHWLHVKTGSGRSGMHQRQRWDVYCNISILILTCNFHSSSACRKKAYGNDFVLIVHLVSKRFASSYTKPSLNLFGAQRNFWVRAHATLINQAQF